MSDYKDMGVNSFYQPYNAPVTSGTTLVSGYDFQSNNERNAVTSAFLGTFSADKIVAGTIDSAVIYSGSITANQLSGGTIVLGGTLNGSGLMQIKNPSGSVIIQGDNTGHHYFDGTVATEKITLNEGGFTAYNTGGTKVIEVDAGGLYGYDGAVITTHIGAGDNYFSGAMNIRDATGGTLMGQVGMDVNSKVNLYASGDTYLESGADVHIKASDDIYLDAGSGGSGHNVDITCDNFYINSEAKTVVLPTSQGYRALYCTESPEVWFMDFIPDSKELSPLFQEVTIPPYRFIKCEDGGFQVWGKRKDQATKRFEEMTEEQYKKNNKFWNQAHN